MKHPGMVIGWLVRTIVKQLANADVKYVHINKWLRSIGHPLIHGYMILPNRAKEPVIFFEYPGTERIKELGGRYIPILV